MKNYSFYLLLSGLIFSFLVSIGQEETTLVQISDPVPVFSYEKSPGIVQNISELKGKTVLITFFATWCGPCRKELPFIQAEIYNKYKNSPKFEVLIFGREHSWEEVSNFKAENKFSMPFYPDPERKIYSLFAGQYIPRNFLVSAEGKILFSSVGFEEKDFETLKKLIEKQVKNK
ncbi:MAG: TlpA disulfide reductase family protein [Prolixibacteraceae bacterium]